MPAGTSLPIHKREQKQTNRVRTHAITLPTRCEHEKSSRTRRGQSTTGNVHGWLQRSVNIVLTLVTPGIHELPA